MLRLSLLSLGLMAHAAPARAAAEQSVWLTALSAAYVVMDINTGDVDGDATAETVVCYREDVGRTAQRSGIVILKGKAPDQMPVFHVQLDSALCEKVRIANGKVGILLQGKQQLVWSYGDQIKFRRNPGGLYATATIKASSAMDPSHAADRAVDGDLTTSWAEGAAGTGIGQTLTVRFAKPTDVGAIGIFAGSAVSSRAFFDANRIHRGSIEAKTSSDMGDSASGLDFASLGIDSIGDRSEFTCENKPLVTYVDVQKKDVVELQIRVESVYLGDKRDETHIAELDIVPLLSLSETVDRATPVKTGSAVPSVAVPVPGAVQIAPASAAPAAVSGDDSIKKLDGSGSIVPDDF